MTKAEELADQMTEFALDRKALFGEGPTVDMLNQAARRARGE